MPTEPARPARVMNPMQFFDDGPFALMGDKQGKDFTAEVTEVDPDEKSDPGSQNSGEQDIISGPEQLAKAGDDVTTEPEISQQVEYEASKKSDKPIEDVDAPVLEASSGESGGSPGTPGSSASEDQQPQDEADDEGNDSLDLS